MKPRYCAWLNHTASARGTLEQAGIADELIPVAQNAVNKDQESFNLGSEKAQQKFWKVLHDKEPIPVRIMVMTFPQTSPTGMTRSRSWRRQDYLWYNRRHLRPQIIETVPNPVNGLNITQTFEALLVSRVPFHRLCQGHESWGTLANFLTRFRAFEAQIQARVPWQVTIEDDMALGKKFPEFVGRIAAAHLPSNSSFPESLWERAPVLWPNNQVLRGLPTAPGFVRLGKYGDGYMTSLAAAKQLVQRFRKVGIIRCPDQQINGEWWHNASVLNLHHQTPWAGLAEHNTGGDIARSYCLSGGDQGLLKNLTLLKTTKNMAAKLAAAISKPPVRHNMRRDCFTTLRNTAHTHALPYPRDKDQPSFLTSLASYS
eukprot:CAMPEP_0119310952 /NCGR_PEP_ID=MMETSP1333-20130426/20973_1 /TAXON_ID=418940 /ORGANISM="Scyphosphaera apsteinii, Strain RCC1455" /LENGTH=370 /DNA_ID=CAMNT_0007315221 /DNA_START=232 /DNA_END=1344 /DNA_ORIENTATION=+